MSARAMKDSGVAWLGEIPTEWRTARIVRVARLESGHTPSRQVSDYWKPSECTIPWFSLADVWQLRSGRQEYLGETAEKVSPTGVANSSARVLPKGTVVLSRTASVGFSGIMPVPMATTQDFANWVCGELLLPEYLLFVLRSMKHEFEHMTQGSTHQTIYMPDLKKLAIPIPPKAEQEKIVSRIRARTATIDAALAEHERNLDLLAERRRTLTSSAVTRGLDPAAPMRDSGVSWIGPIPVTWNIVDLRRLVDPSRPITYGIVLPGENVADGVPIVKSGDCTPERLTPERLHRTTRAIEASYGRSRLKGGDLVISIRGTVGLVAQVPPSLEGANLTQDAARIAPTADTDTSWLLHALRSTPIQIEIAHRTVGATVRGLNLRELRRLVLPVPPKAEQRHIAAFLDEHAAPIDAAAEKTRCTVELLREYRQSLITAAVTGRLRPEDTH